MNKHQLYSLCDCTSNAGGPIAASLQSLWLRPFWIRLQLMKFRERRELTFYGVIAGKYILYIVAVQLWFTYFLY